MRGLLGVCFALVSAMSLAVLAAGSSPTEKKADIAPVKVGLLLDSLKVERWQTDLDVFQKRAKELGAEVLVETAEGQCPPV